MGESIMAHTIFISIFILVLVVGWIWLYLVVKRMMLQRHVELEILDNITVDIKLVKKEVDKLKKTNS
jgi:hypothetical protein